MLSMSVVLDLVILVGFVIIGTNPMSRLLCMKSLVISSELGRALVLVKNCKAG